MPSKSSPRPPPVRITGTLKPILTRRRETYDTTKGKIETEEWESAGDNLDGLAKECVKEAIPYELNRNGVKSHLVKYPSAGQSSDSQEQTIDTWQVLASEET